ncbi:hypothetical protein Tco_1165265, partial [Tanacetum coccineum]
VHARKKPKSEDVDYAAVAAMTDRMVGAELVNILEVAAIHDAELIQSTIAIGRGADEIWHGEGQVNILQYFDF